MRQQVGDVQIAYERRGSGDAVMFVTGTGYPGGTWWPATIDHLAERFTVVTFDHRGTGRSDTGDHPYSTQQFAADALGLLEALGIGRAHVVGHSMGGRVAQWMALQQPARVASLVLAGTGAGSHDPDGRWQGVPLYTAAGMAEHGYEGYMRAHIARTFFTPEFARSRPDVVGWLVDAFWSGRPTVEHYLRHVIARQQHTTTARLRDIQTPALVVVGDRDTNGGPTGSHVEQSRVLADGLPNARMVTVPDVSHGLFWQAPDEMERLLADWVQDRRQPGATTVPGADGRP